MVSQPFSTIITGDQQLDRIQQNIANSFNNVTGPFIGGQFLTGIKVGSSATSINTGLGRIPKLWVLCDQNTNTSVWRIAWDANTITLQAGSACIVNLWVN